MCATLSLVLRQVFLLATLSLVLRQVFLLALCASQSWVSLTLSPDGDGPQVPTCSLSSLAYLLSELIQYTQSRCRSHAEVESRLQNAGYEVGQRVVEILGYRCAPCRLAVCPPSYPTVLANVLHESYLHVSDLARHSELCRRASLRPVSRSLVSGMIHLIRARAKGSKQCRL